MKKDYLKVMIGSRGEVVLNGIEWLKNKEFKEIEEMGREDYEYNIEDMDEEYVEEFCGVKVNDGICVMVMLNEEDYDIYINEDYVKEIKEMGDYREWVREEFERFREIICEFEFEYFKFE